MTQDEPRRPTRIPPGDRDEKGGGMNNIRPAGGPDAEQGPRVGGLQTGTPGGAQNQAGDAVAPAVGEDRAQGPGMEGERESDSP